MLRLHVLIPDSCDDCGLCCEGIGSPVLLYATQNTESAHPFRPPDLPCELIEEIDFNFRGLSRGQEPQERCLWFDSVHRCCKHYEWRPQICHDFELAGDACLLDRRPHVIGLANDDAAE